MQCRPDYIFRSHDDSFVDAHDDFSSNPVELRSIGARSTQVDIVLIQYNIVHYNTILTGSTI